MFSPFSLKISPIERLFLINFEKDPDEIYSGLEPQWFDDASYGKGLRVIAWRKDGYVDVYQQPGLTIEETIDVAAKGLADTTICPMRNARFNVTKSGVDVAFDFEDKTGRKIEVEIVEKSQKPTHPFSLLAPVGSSSVNPTSLPVYFMFKFDFVRQKHTDVHISIGGRLHKADPFTFPINGSRVYYMRYSADAFLVDWCPAQSHVLASLKFDGQHYHDSNNTRYEFTEDAHHPAIARIQSSRNNHTFTAEFHPPFPELNSIVDNASHSGAFILGADASAGLVKGTYKASRSGDLVEVTMHPDGGWEPKPKTLFLKFLFSAAKIFRHWPKTYLWTAQIKLSDSVNSNDDDGDEVNALPFMDSKWTRI